MVTETQATYTKPDLNYGGLAALWSTQTQFAVTSTYPPFAGLLVSAQTHMVKVITFEVRLGEERKGRFRDLADWWHSDTDGLSVDSQKFEHEAYDRIIDEFGDAAVGYMLEDLRDRGGHWFSALRELTGETVDEGANGNMKRARRAWLDWGLANNLI